MSDRRNNEFTAEEQQALTALRRLPRARASEPARTRARSAFLAVAAQPRKAVRRRSRWAALAAAAVLGALALLMIGRQPAEQWVVLDILEPGGVRVDGRTVQVGDRITSGDLRTVQGSELELQLGEKLRFRMLAGTELSLPAAPGRWFDRERVLRLSSGEIYGTTSDRPLDFPLEFATDELSARLTGTTFAVFRTLEASCVCLWEGGITVTPAAGGKSVVLEPLQRIWIYKDGRPHAIMPLSDMETMKLQMMQDGGLQETDP